MGIEYDKLYDVYRQNDVLLDAKYRAVITESEYQSRLVLLINQARVILGFEAIPPTP